MPSRIYRVSGRAMSTTANTTNPAPRYSGIPTFFRAPLVDMHQCTPEELGAVDVGIMGVPFDNGATNAPGARFGPRGVRTSSVNNVRRYNQATGAAPFDLGLAIADLGDAHVSRPFELVGAHKEIEAHMSKVLDAGITPLSVGGDHSVSLPLLRALAKQRAGLPPPGLLHIDAHCDTGDDYGGSRFHHGAPFKIAVDEGLIDPLKTLQIGIRGSLAFPEVWAFSSASGMRVLCIDECFELGPRGVLDEVGRVMGGGSECYVSFDIDALDPAYAPGTGTPEVGGLSTNFAQQLVRGFGTGGLELDILGADLVEVSPPFDHAELTSLAGANILFELLCVTTQATARRARGTFRAGSS